jgi:glucosylceramidase
MKNFIFSIIISSILCYSCEEKTSESSSTSMSILRTSFDKKYLLTQTDTQIFFQNANNNYAIPTIEIDTTSTFQIIDGFGYTLTGGSAYHINQKLDSTQRKQLLEELFSKTSGIKISYLRISIGASDLDADVFSYNDLPEEDSDINLTKFDIKPDKANLIPLLKQILAINPEIKLMGSAWSAPSWMKTNKKSIGGSLNTIYYPTYAQYFVKYLQEMQKEGIHIDAITIQNEPENPHNNPSMTMTATEQTDFIKNHLGVAFAKSNIKTKIIIFDHNCDHPEYPIKILNDSIARKYIGGSAFHLYAGDISALSKVHNTHPDKDIFFTEQWTSSDGNFGGDLAWHTKNVTIGATRNWSKIVLAWNLAADTKQEPHTKGGCTNCLGALTIDNQNITKNVSYYAIAHFAKFVYPGAKRIASNFIETLPNVAFMNPNGSKAIIILNEEEEAKNLNIKINQKIVPINISAKSVTSLCWQ